MALLPTYNYFILNGEIKSASEFIDSENDGGIYEVIRVEKNIPLFLDDHLLRFYKSAEIANIRITYSNQELERFLKLLIKKNNVNEGNLLISFKSCLKIFCIRYKYPELKDYYEGVNCGVLLAERENPNAKVFQTLVRQKANKLIYENGFYEVLLVDNSGRITEGSRSNIFFVKENQIITPPGTGVLLGITRQKTIQLIKLLGINYIEKEVYSDELHTFEAIFITGTSPKILPVKQVGKILFNPQNEILQSLIKQFNLLVDEYLKIRLPN
ncbi:MAG: aminotransferase class IV [Draconibacterium sp.]|nr:aminotransferase class IV [Draconibacterium sp.]